MKDVKAVSRRALHDELALDGGRIRLLGQTVDQLWLGGLHFGRRQAGEHRFKVVDDHAPDGVHVLPDGAGAVGGEDGVGGGANGMVIGQRFLREDVDGGAETALMQQTRWERLMRSRTASDLISESSSRSSMALFSLEGIASTKMTRDSESRSWRLTGVQPRSLMKLAGSQGS